MQRHPRGTQEVFSRHPGLPQERPGGCQDWPRRPEVPRNPKLRSTLRHHGGSQGTRAVVPATCTKAIVLDSKNDVDDYFHEDGSDVTLTFLLACAQK